MKIFVSVENGKWDEYEIDNARRWKNENDTPITNATRKVMATSWNMIIQAVEKACYPIVVIYKYFISKFEDMGDKFFQWMGAAEGTFAKMFKSITIFFVKIFVYIEDFTGPFWAWAYKVVLWCVSQATDIILLPFTIMQKIFNKLDINIFDWLDFLYHLLGQFIGKCFKLIDTVLHPSAIILLITSVVVGAMGMIMIAATLFFVMLALIGKTFEKEKNKKWKG